jgi:hypothetical protein
MASVEKVAPWSEGNVQFPVGQDTLMIVDVLVGGLTRAVQMPASIPEIQGAASNSDVILVVTYFEIGIRAIWSMARWQVWY